jgi:alpha-glucosidase
MRRARAAAVLVMTLRGTVFVYQGEELGLEDLDLRPSQWQDPDGRDVCRGPLPWEREAPHGWPGQPTWLPFPPEPGVLSVEAQQGEPDSILNLYRRLIHLRKGSRVLRYGAWQALDLLPGVLSYRRDLGDDEVVVLVNFEELPREVPLEGDWEIHVDSLAFEGRGELARYEGRVEPEQALLLAPATDRGRSQTDTVGEG